MTADLHSLLPAYESFASKLRHGYDLGVIAGDLLDEYLSDDELVRMLRLDPDTLLPELPGPDDTADEMVHRWREGSRSAHMEEGLAIKEREIKDILNTAGKPVLVVPGNHDVTSLATEGIFINIHLREYSMDGQRFVGYGGISRELGSECQMSLLDRVESLVDEKTVLVTHFPPYALLDNARADSSTFHGSRILADLVARRKPRFHFFGHVHAGVGVSMNSINAAYPLVGCFCGVDTMTSEIWTEPG